MADAPRPSSRSSLRNAKSSFSLKNRLTLNVEKFDQVLSPDFTSGFEESEDCFSEVTHKAAALIGAEKCFLFIRDAKEQVGAGVDFELLSNSLTFECRNPQLPETFLVH